MFVIICILLYILKFSQMILSATIRPLFVYLYFKTTESSLEVLASAFPIPTLWLRIEKWEMILHIMKNIKAEKRIPAE